MNKKLIYDKRIVDEIETKEGRSYRKADSVSEPSMTRSSIFSIEGEDSETKFHFSFDGISRECYWPEFVESGDEITFYVQKPIFSRLPYNVVAFVNHTKDTGIQRCMLGSRYIFMILSIFAILALANLADGKPIGTLGYSLIIPMLSVYSFYLTRYLQRFSYQGDFERYIKAHHPRLSFSEKKKMRAALWGKLSQDEQSQDGQAQNEQAQNEQSQNEQSQTEQSQIQQSQNTCLRSGLPEHATRHVPTENTISPESSQYRYLDFFKGPLWNERDITRIDFSAYMNKTFDELKELRDENLWHLVLKGKLRGIVVVLEKDDSDFRLSKYKSQIIPMPGVDFSLLERSRLRPSIRDSLGEISNYRIVQKGGEYTADWWYGIKDKPFKWTSNQERRRRKKRG